MLHWADGGETSASNLVLLCRRHHRMVHAPGGFRLELLEGRPVFSRPDGTVMGDRGPPVARLAGGPRFILPTHVG